MTSSLPHEPSTGVRRLELRIAVLLRAGVLASAGLMAFGWAWEWVASAGDGLGSAEAFAALGNYQSRPLSAELASLVAAQAWPVLLCYFGLFLLVLLPLVRVFLTSILFARQREKLLSALAAGVFLALIASFFLGLEI
jgi:uncharacterized membrane protein